IASEAKQSSVFLLHTFSGLLRFARNDADFFFALYAFLCVLCGEMVFAGIPATLRSRLKAAHRQPTPLTSDS
ncbi:MAG: hypothetical protein FWC38_00005, partial [Proteobacteria bacterium]|nr:hypothetical protein [Pseudomonadota bacterium]MCL2306625.1 hypothetical protein [Pseudomonadota bacterium]